MIGLVHTSCEKQLNREDDSLNMHVPSLILPNNPSSKWNMLLPFFGSLPFFWFLLLSPFSLLPTSVVVIKASPFLVSSMVYSPLSYKLVIPITTSAQSVSECVFLTVSYLSFLLTGHRNTVAWCGGLLEWLVEREGGDFTLLWEGARCQLQDSSGRTTKMKQ